MSLINRMLKDLSTREPASGNVMSGIQVPASMRPARPAVLPRLGAMLILVTVFTAGLWWLFGPRNVPSPTARAASNADLTRTATPPASAEDIAVASAPVSPAQSPPAPDTSHIESAAPAPRSQPAATGIQAVATSEAAAASASAAAAQNASAPMTADAYYAQGRRDQNRGDLNTAASNYIQALDLDPNLHAAREHLIALRLDQKRLSNARHGLQRGLQLAPTHVPYQQLAQRLEAALEAANPVDKSAATPRAATASTASAPGVREATARYAEAREALARGDEKTAEQKFVDALALDPKLHPAREDLGTLRVRQGRLAEAERSVRRGQEEDPEWIGYRRLIARLELARNNPTAALTQLERDPPSVERDPEYHGLLASAYQRLSRHQDAARVYQSLTQSQPGEAHWWAGYAISRDSLGESAEALKAYAQARTLGQLDARVLEYIDRRVAALRDD